MEPLLQRIKESRSAVLVPIIDVIDDTTLEYYNGNGRYFQVVSGRSQSSLPSKIYIALNGIGVNSMVALYKLL